MEEFEYKKYGCELLEEKGYTVEVWVCVKMFFPECPIPQLKAKEKNIFEINSYYEFIKKLYENRKQSISFIFITPARCHKIFTFAALIKLFGFEYCITDLQPILNESNFNKSVDDIKFDLWGTFLTLLFPPKYNFMATKICYLHFFSKSLMNPKRDVFVHTLDYDKYLDWRIEGKTVNEDYIVYIDDGGAGHRDYELLKMENIYKNELKRLKELNNLFSMLEKKYRRRVVIAAHPRVVYKENPFERREIFYQQTDSLIQSAKMVILSLSTAIDLVILYNKPFIFIGNEASIKTFSKNFCSYEKFLEIKCLNISRMGNEDLEKYVNDSTQHGCQKYRRMYVKNKNTEQTKFFEIVARMMSEKD